MKKLFILLPVLILINFQVSAQRNCRDTIDTLSKKINNLEYTMDQIQRDKINYQIEKDLLKETYSRNYETINLIITLILGVIGVFAFFGLRDINAIKKEYSKELENLRETKRDFDVKSKEFEKEKGRFEDEIKKIIQTNETQSNKIKVLELKEKIHKLLDENKVYEALEFINASIAIAPEDSSLFNSQGIVYTRLNQLDKAQVAFEKALTLDPENQSWILNLIEFYCFIDDFVKVNSLIETHKTIYESKSNNGLKVVKELFELYHKKDDKGLTDYITNLIDKNDLESQKARLTGWRLTEAKYIAFYQPDNALKDKLQNIIWYLGGQINGNTIIKKLGLKI